MIGLLKIHCRFASEDERKFETHFGDSLSPFGALNKDLGVASQMLLTEVRLRLQRRLLFV